jgi:S1-C subfamily serine protease
LFTTQACRKEGILAVDPGPAHSRSFVARVTAASAAGVRALRTALPILGLAGLAIGACTGRYVIGERGPQAYYQTGHPVRDTSQDLERIFRSVKRMQVTGFYTTYRFSPTDSITVEDLRRPATFRRAVDRFTFDHTRAGTATVVGRSGRRVTLITNEHVTRVPDTVIVYFGAAPGAPPPPADRRFVESVAIRTNQRNLVVGLPGAEPFRVIARDSAADVAVIGLELPGDGPHELHVVNIRRGDPSRLRWGSFVYVMGYPRGFQMVTRAIVSEPNRDRDNGFLLDGLFNRGISGGLILAVRGDSEELEWVGMAMAASAQHEFVLLPDEGRFQETGMLLPYDGGLHIERVTRIDYGITFSVPMPAIRRLMTNAGVWITNPPGFDS